MVHQIIQANIILLIQYTVGSLVPLLLIPHIVRVIGLTEYGHLAVLIAVGGYGAVIVQYAFHLTGPRRIVYRVNGESAGSIFIDITCAKLILLLLVHLIMAGIVYFLAPLRSSSPYAYIILFVLPAAACLNSVWFLQSVGRFLPVCVLASVGALFTLLIGFTLIEHGMGHAIDFAVITSVFAALFTGGGTMILAFGSIEKTFWRWDLIRIINVLQEGWHLFFSQFVSMIYSSSGPIVISALIDAKTAGAYSVTERVINAIMSAALLTHTAAYPRLASAYKNNRISYWKTMKLILLAYLLITLLISILALVFHDSLMLFLFGMEQTSEYRWLLIFGLGWLVLGIFGTALTGYLTVSGQSDKVWPLTLKVLVLSITIGIPSVILWGGAGWLFALVISQLFVLYTGFQYWRKEYAV